jgi:hypothetical protein
MPLHHAPNLKLMPARTMLSLKTHTGANGASAVPHGRSGRIRQINEEIFCFDCPIGREGNFDPGADRPVLSKVDGV